MILFRKAAALSGYLAGLRNNGAATGFVPTMGALHPGHISLIRQARQSANVVVCSIFVNPTQFNDPADFEKYPVTTDADIDLLHASGCDILFLPSVEEMYPPGRVKQRYDLANLETMLEGQYRPGHFQGVCQVIDRLLEVVSPQLFFLGQKDYQQCMVVSRLLSLTGLENKVKLTIAPTMRESDGLAMSSRNVRLDHDQRRQAPTIFRALSYVAEHLNHQPPGLLINQAGSMLAAAGFRVDYVAIASANDLRPVGTTPPDEPLVVLIAAFLGDVRLIDNLIVPARS